VQGGGARGVALVDPQASKHTYLRPDDGPSACRKMKGVQSGGGARGVAFIVHTPMHQH
jgi:hypothetical protein